MAEKDDSLRDSFHKIAKERGYSNGNIDIQDISSGGANFSSTLHLATISAPEKEDLKLFAKVAAISDDLRASCDTFTKCLTTERVFYTELAVAFEKLYNKHGVQANDRLYIPKYYGHNSTNKRETIVLENLVASGFEDFDRFKSIDWDYASAAVAELAKFHALGIAAQEENLEELESMRRIELDLFEMKNMKEVFINQAFKMGKETVKEEYRARVQKYLKEGNIKMTWLSYGNHVNQVSSSTPINGKLEVVPLDYQIVHFGPLVADLMVFIWSGSDSEFRRKYYHKLFEHYYTELTIALENLHVDINKVYPRKKFEKELEDSKTLGLALGLGMMSLLMVEPDNAPRLNNMEDMAVVPSQLALEKMNGVVEDYIRWGII